MKEIDLSVKARLRNTVRKYTVILLLGIAYLIWLRFTGIGIPCVFRLISGLKCPACGVTRMIVSLSRFDVASAFEHNPFLFVTSPVILFCLIYSDVSFVIRNDPSLGKFGFLLWIEVILAIVFGIVRNIVTPI